MDRSKSKTPQPIPASSPLTVRDLARLTGLSKSTVSYALRDSGRIKASTRLRVQTFARSLGYTPNLVAATLASSKKTGPVHALRIAFVTDLASVGYNTQWFSATRPFLENLGYAAEAFDLHRHHLSPAALRKRLYHEGYSGVIFSEIREERSEIFAEDWSPFCVVTTRRAHHYTPFDQVRTNPFETVATAWRKTREAGYRRVGFLLCRHHPHRMLDDFEREGALFVMQQHLETGEVAIPPYLGNLSDPDAIRAWQLLHQPDAVVGFNFFHYTLLEQAGYRMPRDFGFVSLHAQGSSSETAHVAHVDPGEDEIPRISAEYMDELIRHRRMGYPKSPREILAAVTWAPGPTLPSIIPRPV